MRKRVLVFAILACAIASTSASAQGIPAAARRVGVGISVGGIFPTDDDVNAGLVGREDSSASRLRPDSARRSGSGGTRAI